MAIVGPSGSGKTTLCNLMARFWDVQGGSVRLGGRDVRGVQLRQASSAISPLCFSGSICSPTPSPTISALGKPDALHGGGAGPPRKKPAATTLSWHCRTALTPSSAKAVLTLSRRRTSANFHCARHHEGTHPSSFWTKPPPMSTPENEKELMEAVAGIDPMIRRSS